MGIQARARPEAQQQALELRFEFRQLLTEEEWTRIFKRETGYHDAKQDE